MLRDWTNSDKIDIISIQAEVFFVRLIMKVDDFGCFYADPRLLKANLFPLKLEKIREADILRWTAECQKAELIVLYEHTSKRYLQIKDFRQRLDKAKSKYPLPDSAEVQEIVNDFLAEERNRSRKEVEVERERMAPTNFNLELPEVKINAAIEYLSITKHADVTKEMIISIWTLFKQKFFAGRKKYQDEGDIFRHFFETLKFEKINGTNRQPNRTGIKTGNSKSAGANQLLESLRKDYHGS